MRARSYMFRHIFGIRNRVQSPTLLAPALLGLNHGVTNNTRQINIIRYAGMVTLGVNLMMAACWTPIRLSNQGTPPIEACTKRTGNDPFSRRDKLKRQAIAVLYCMVLVDNSATSLQGCGGQSPSYAFCHQLKSPPRVRSPSSVTSYGTCWCHVQRPAFVKGSVFSTTPQSLIE